jgi:hypothetical protein
MLSQTLLMYEYTRDELGRQICMGEMRNAYKILVGKTE